MACLSSHCKASSCLSIDLGRFIALGHASPQMEHKTGTNFGLVVLSMSFGVPFRVLVARLINASKVALPIPCGAVSL